ncbi:MAG: hypothetical protein ACXW0Q_03620 [Methylovulum sp.]
MQSESSTDLSDKAALVVLTGITADHVKKSQVLKYFQENSQFSVFVPTLCQYFGIGYAARQLVYFLKRHNLAFFSKCHFICYISGGFILRCAIAAQPLENIGRVVYIRSPFQEQAPNLAIQKYGRLLAMLRYGKMLFDLASPLKNNLPLVCAEDGLVIEHGISELALQLGLKNTDFDIYRNRADFVAPAAHEEWITELSHYEVYNNDELLETIARFIQSGSFTGNSPMLPNKSNSVSGSNL